MTPVETLPLPHLAADFMLRPDIAFLNHGSYGACPRPVFETYQAWQQELEAQPVEFLGRRLPDLLAEARQALAGYVGARANDLVFVSNATHGVNIVARSLNLQPGDEVLGTDHEYGATERTWRFVCQKRGARYVSQPLPWPIKDRAEVVEQFWAGVNERTRVIFLSHITSPTALILPVADICRRARAAGILTVIDGAHAPGHIDLDLATLDADFYTGNCHKWLCAPKGAGFLYARPEHQPALEPLVVSWGWESLNPGPSPFLDYFQWLGTDDPSAYLSVPAAIEYQRRHNWPQVRAACRRLAAQARTRLQALTGLPELCPDEDQWWQQMVIAALPPCDPVAVGKRLWSDFQVEVPVMDWNGRPLIRVSIQAYNHPDHVDRLLAGLAAALA